MDEAQLLEVLDRATCLELLAHHGFVGRLGFVVDGRPIILPVNYIVDGDSVVFCTASGTKLNTIRGGANVAFEVDDSVPLHHSGWSVLVQGHADLVTDPADLTPGERATGAAPTDCARRCRSRFAGRAAARVLDRRTPCPSVPMERAKSAATRNRRTVSGRSRPPLLPARGRSPDRRVCRRPVPWARGRRERPWIGRSRA